MNADDKAVLELIEQIRLQTGVDRVVIAKVLGALGQPKVLDAFAQFIKNSSERV